MWETKASELFAKGINELVENGWTAKRITDLTYELTDAAGVMVLGTCYIEQYPGKERYSVFVKLNDALAPIGTVARDENDLFQCYDLEGVIYKAKEECCVCGSTENLYSSTPSTAGAYVVKTFCLKCIDADLPCDVETGEFIFADATACENEQAARIEWEQNNVCSRCAGALDKHAIEVEGKAICKSCQTTEDFFFQQCQAHRKTILCVTVHLDSSEKGGKIMVKALGEQVSALFPQEQKQEVDYEKKYKFLVTYIKGITDAVQHDDTLAGTMELIQDFIKELDEQKL